MIFVYYIIFLNYKEVIGNGNVVLRETKDFIKISILFFQLHFLRVPFITYNKVLIITDITIIYYNAYTIHIIIVIITIVFHNGTH